MLGECVVLVKTHFFNAERRCKKKIYIIEAKKTRAPESDMP
jgi:hypothetical protein